MNEFLFSEMLAILQAGVLLGLLIAFALHESWGLVKSSAPVLKTKNWFKRSANLLLFRLIFGDWPTENPHLFEAQMREVEKVLQKRAQDYHEIIERESKLLSAVKQEKATYWLAKEQLTSIRSIQNKREKNFSRAERVARFFEFVAEDSGHYTSYLVEEAS